MMQAPSKVLARSRIWFPRSPVSARSEADPLWFFAVTLPIYASALYLSNQATGRRLELEAERHADELAAQLAASLDAVIRPIEGGIRTIAYQLEEVDPPPALYPQRILGILGAWPDVYGSTIAVGVGSRGTDTQPVAPYLFRGAAGIDSADLARDSYAYSKLPWYRAAVDGRKPVWSEPYFDAGGGDIWMVTYSVPFFRRQEGGERVLAGVVTADLSLDWVRSRAAEVDFSPEGMGWLSSATVEPAFPRARRSDGNAHYEGRLCPGRRHGHQIE